MAPAGESGELETTAVFGTASGGAGSVIRNSRGGSSPGGSASGGSSRAGPGGGGGLSLPGGDERGGAVHPGKTLDIQGVVGLEVVGGDESPAIEGSHDSVSECGGLGIDAVGLVSRAGGLEGGEVELGEAQVDALAGDGGEVDHLGALGGVGLGEGSVGEEESVSHGRLGC